MIRLPGNWLRNSWYIATAWSTRLLGGEILPVGQHVGGDEIDGIAELRMVAPDVPDFAGCHRNIDRLLDTLDQPYEPMNVVFRDRPLQRFGPACP